MVCCIVCLYVRDGLEVEGDWLCTSVSVIFVPESESVVPQEVLCIVY